jgi:hypothetical protein
MENFFSVVQIPEHIKAMRGTILKNFGSKYQYKNPNPKPNPNPNPKKATNFFGSQSEQNEFEYPTLRSRTQI